MTAGGGNFIKCFLSRNKRSAQWAVAPIEAAAHRFEFERGQEQKQTEEPSLCLPSVLLLIHKPPDILHCLVTFQQVPLNADFAVFLCRQEQDLRRDFRLVGEGLREVVPVRIADDNAALGNLQVPVEQVRPILEPALASLVEDEVIGAGIVAVIRKDEVCDIAVRNSLQNPALHIPDIRALFAVRKAFTGAFSAGMKFEF